MHKTLLAVLALLLFPGVASLAKAQEHKVYRVPFHSVDSMILLNATVNDKPAVLLLDTGAVSTVIDVSCLDSSQQFDLKHAEIRGERAGTHGEAQAATVSLALAGKEWKERRVAAMNLSDVGKHFGTRIDGLLGQDVLSQFSSVRIDYKNHVVELEQ